MASGPRWDSSARLETRTKESNKCASVMLNENMTRTEREVSFVGMWCQGVSHGASLQHQPDFGNRPKF